MLPPQARIAVVAPAGLYDAARLERGMAVVRGWGFTLVPAPHLAARHRYTAGTAPERLADLTWALTSPDIDAVWFARGGFGTAHLLDALPWAALDGRPVLGFSDATALFCPLLARGLRAIHAPVLQGLAPYDLSADPAAIRVDSESREVLRRLLCQGEATRLPGEAAQPDFAPVKGSVVGGNLSVLASLCGTPWGLRSEGRIVALEDTREHPYRIDRLLTQLIAAGGLQGAVGIALGQFDHCRAEGQTYEVREVLHELLAPLGIPVVFGLPFGHTAHNYAFELGRAATLSATGLDWPLVA